jgi:predicted MFS family arabinose efflux permease
VTLATAVSQSFGRFTYSLLFTDVRDDLGMSNTTAGALGSANLLAYLAGSVLVSIVVGRWGLAIVSQIGLVGVVAGLALLAWGPTIAVVAGALVLTGFAAAGVWVTAPAIATGLVGADRRGAAMGLIGMGVGVGIVGASLLDTLLGGDDFRVVYLAELGIGVLVIGALVLSLPRRAPATRVRLNGVAEIRRIPNWRRLLVEYALFAFAMAMVMTFTVGYLEDDAHLSRTVASTSFLLIGIGTLVGGPLFGPLADRVGRLTSQVYSLALMVASTLVVTIGAAVPALIGAFAFGVAFTGGPVTIGARVSDHLEGDAFGAAYGVATIAFGAGLAAGPQFGGILADLADSARPTLWASAAIAAAALAVTLSERSPAPAPSARACDVPAT